MWIDISMPLHQNMDVWPGDTPFSYKLDATLAKDGANVGHIQMSLHAGTHVDAPYHYDDYGKAVDSLPLDLFIGHAFVVECQQVEEITELFLRSKDIPFVERVLLKTRDDWGSISFDEPYTTVSPDAIRYLKSRGVQVIGIDSPSIDPFHSELEAHHACCEQQVYIIENLRLEQVSEGLYDFIGLPLYIRGADASPIRAVVKKVKNAHEKTI